MSAVTHPNMSVSTGHPATKNQTNLQYDYHFHTRTCLLGGKSVSG